LRPLPASAHIICKEERERAGGEREGGREGASERASEEREGEREGGRERWANIIECFGTTRV
jgi:hypothetical protein